MNTMYSLLQFYAMLWVVFWFTVATFCYIIPERGKSIMLDAQKASPTQVLVVLLSMPMLILPVFLYSLIVNNISGEGKEHDNDK